MYKAESDADEMLEDRLKSFMYNARQKRPSCLDPRCEDGCFAIRILCTDSNTSCGAVQIILKDEKHGGTEINNMLEKPICNFDTTQYQSLVGNVNNVICVRRVSLPCLDISITVHYIFIIFSGHNAKTLGWM